MPTPYRGYFIDDERVPSVTTVLSRFKESGGLIHWAWKEGIAGRDYRDARDAAGSVGTMVHDLAERRSRGETITDIEPKAMAGYSAFCEWWELSRFKLIATEEEMVSKRHRYGGTPDAIVVDHKNRVCVIDYKTGNRIYPEAIIQCAAYGALWDENHPDKAITGPAHVIRFDRDSGDFMHRMFTNTRLEWEQFLTLRKAYELDGTISQRIR